MGLNWSSRCFKSRSILPRIADRPPWKRRAFECQQPRFRYPLAHYTSDGTEDANHNGALDVGESDPGNAASTPGGGSGNSRQVPVPPWALVLLAVSLLVTALRRRER